MVGAETELSLRETLRATFGSNGEATASVSVGTNQRWKVTLMNTRTNSSTQTHIIVYRGVIGGPRLDFSRTGNDDTSNTDFELRQGETLVAHWTGGTVGASAQLDIEGSKFLKGLRGYGV